MEERELGTTMIHRQLEILTSVLLLFSLAKQNMPPSSSQSDKQKAGYLGQVRQVTTETEILSRKLLP